MNKKVKTIIALSVFACGAAVGYITAKRHVAKGRNEHGPVKSDDTVYGKLDEFHSLGPSLLTASIIEKYKLSRNDTAEDIMRAINELRTGEEKKG